MEEKLWKPLGMEADGSWSLDSRKHRNAKAFCCLNGIARDYARLGRLFLHKGNWNGVQIVPESWMAMTTGELPEGKTHHYRYQWRILENGAFFAAGILGQYIYVDPAKNMIIIRNGLRKGDINWVRLFYDISNQ